MRIAVDMQGAQGENSNRGIGRYSIALVKQMIKSAHDDEFILVLNGMLRQTIENVKAEFSELIPAEWFQNEPDRRDRVVGESEGGDLCRQKLNLNKTN